MFGQPPSLTTSHTVTTFATHYMTNFVKHIVTCPGNTRKEGYTRISRVAVVGSFVILMSVPYVPDVVPLFSEQSVQKLNTRSEGGELFGSSSLVYGTVRLKTECNIRLLQSHMRLKKNRPYNHWLKGQGHHLLCFSTSRTVGASSVRL